MLDDTAMNSSQTDTTSQQTPLDAQEATALAPTPELQTLVEEVEVELLEEITKNLENETITPDHAQGLAKEFLALLPIHDKHDLLTKLSELSNVNHDTQELYLKFGKPIDDEERQEKLRQMSEHIKNGSIEEAIAVAKGAQNAS